MDKRERRDSLRREFHSFKQEGYQQGTYRVISEKGNEGNRGGIGGQATEKYKESIRGCQEKENIRIGRAESIGKLMARACRL